MKKDNTAFSLLPGKSKLMNSNRTSFFIIFVFFFLLFATQAEAQMATPEDKFRQARELVFEQKNYKAAIALCREALQQSPDYTDIRVFLGRAYYWNNQPDSSLAVLKEAFQNQPDHEDAALALADIEYYRENYTVSLYYSEQGLRHHPSSRQLMLRKIKNLAALTRFKEAYGITDSLLTADPTNSQLRPLADQLKEYSSNNRIGISYDHTYFDRQFAHNWHLSGIEYTRQTLAGSFTGRLNYANRFARDGFQVEVESYPRLSKTFYTYTNLGFSKDLPVFPKFRAGFSLYANLPRSYEGELGFRYLNFNNDTWIYTASLGKYYRKLWFNARTYLAPSQNQVSPSYAFTTRYYLKGADDFLSFTIGQGITPDDRSQAVQLNNEFRIQTFRLGAGYHFTVRKLNVFMLNVRYEHVEFRPETKGNQINTAIGYQRRF